MNFSNRREFIKKTTTTAAGMMLSAPVIKAGFGNKSPNDIINVAVVGIRGKGGMYGAEGTMQFIPLCLMSG